MHTYVYTFPVFTPTKRTYYTKKGWKSERGICGTVSLFLHRPPHAHLIHETTFCTARFTSFMRGKVKSGIGVHHTTQRWTGRPRRRCRPLPHAPLTTPAQDAAPCPAPLPPPSSVSLDRSGSQEENERIKRE